MFRGVNIINLDAKGRFAMPTRYRADLFEQAENKLVLTVDRDHCLMIYPFPDWQELERKIMRLPSYNKQARSLQRLLVGYATEVDMDGQGRILVAPPLRSFAVLDKRAVLIGQGNRFELWDEQRWNNNCESWFAEGDLEQGEMPPELESLSL